MSLAFRWRWMAELQKGCTEPLAAWLPSHRGGWNLKLTRPRCVPPLGAARQLSRLAADSCAAGWTREFALYMDDGAVIGDGSVVVAGPWRDNPAVYKFFVEPEHRKRPSRHSGNGVRACPARTASSKPPALMYLSQRPSGVLRTRADCCPTRVPKIAIGNTRKPVGG